MRAAGVPADFSAEVFTHEGISHTVLWSGVAGWERADTGDVRPGVLVMPEIPGVTPRVIDFARRVVDLGCAVAVPSLFGEPGRSPSAPYVARSLAGACISREFRAFAVGEETPASVWLRALGLAVHARCGGPGVGAVGMCFTGGFALGLAADPHLLAPVLSQPSLPLGVTRAARRGLGVSGETLDEVRTRCAAGLEVLGLRFSADRAVPAERFARLREELGDAFIAVEIDSSRGNPWGIPVTAHSVLTEHLVDESGHPTGAALDQVLEFLSHRLLGGSAER